MCGKYGCDLCARIDRNISTPDATVGGFNLRREVIYWMDLPIPNPIDRDHFLSAAKAKEYIDSNNISFDRLKQMIPDVKTDT